MENSEKDMIEKKFQELEDKAKEIYPSLTDAILQNNLYDTEIKIFENYLELINQVPNNCSSNHITII